MPASTTSQTSTGHWSDALDDDQRRAAEHDAGPLIVLAGPGTGKTRTLMGRIRRLLEDRGAEPESIVALTFSVKAAEEMRRRLAAQIDPSKADRVIMSTFHAYGARLIARFGDMIGVPANLRLMDSSQQRRLIRAIIREHGLFQSDAAQGDARAVDEARQFIAQCRNAGKFAHEAIDYGRAWVARAEANEAGLAGDDLEGERLRATRFLEHARVFEAYEPRALEQGLVTYDDYLSLPIRILRESPAAAALVRSEIDHVLVDEFQDVNAAQIEMLRELAPPATGEGGGRDLCVVGDDDQAIYAFRGSDTQAFGRFASIWEGHTTIELTRNYRSRPGVIALANDVIAKAEDRFAPDKKSVPVESLGLGDEGLVEGVIVEDDYQHGLAIAGMILSDREAHPERSWRDYGVLARIGTDVDRIAAELRLHGIPVSVRATGGVLEDQGVQDLVAWMELCAGRNERLALHRLLLRPPMSLGIDQVDRWRNEWEGLAPEEGADRPLIEFIREHHDAHDRSMEEFFFTFDELRRIAATSTSERFIRELIRRVDVVHNESLEPRERAERVRRVVRVLKFAQRVQGALKPPGDLGAFWSHFDDLDEKERFDLPGDDRLGARDDGASEEPDSDVEAVRVLTAHSAKGLEFDTVFAARVRPGYGFPSSYGSRPWDIDDLPEAFTGRHTPNRAAEERRLFYVTCTRAERRLVLLAKQKKNRTKTIDYYDEIRFDAPQLGFIEHEGRSWIERAGLTIPEAQELSELELGREALRRRELVAARHEAYRALHEAHRAGLAETDLRDVVAQLDGAARRIAALAELESSGALPEWAKGDAALEKIERRHLAGAREASLLRPMRGPLEVSYSRVTDYEKCPRCFYVKHVLGVAEAPSRSLGLGNLVHDALEAFFREVQRAEGEGAAPPDRTRLLAIVDQIAEREAARGGAIESDVIDQARAQATLALEQLHDERDNLLEIERKITFRYPCPLGRHPEGHLFRAKIDRLDQMASGALRIVDYKTGYASKERLEPKKGDLQLAIYALAVAQHMGEGDVHAAPIRGVAEYWLLSRGARGSIAIEDLDFSKARQRINDAITGMLEGVFEKGKTCDGLCEILPTDRS